MFPNDTDSKWTCEIIDYLCKENDAKKPPLVVGIKKT